MSTSIAMSAMIAYSHAGQANFCLTIPDDEKKGKEVVPIVWTTEIGFLACLCLFHLGRHGCRQNAFIPLVSLSRVFSISGCL